MANGRYFDRAALDGVLAAVQQNLPDTEKELAKERAKQVQAGEWP